MTDARSFAGRLRAAFGAAVLLSALTAIVTIVAVRSVARRTDVELHALADVTNETARLRQLAERQVSLLRTWQLTGDDRALDELQSVRARTAEGIASLEGAANDERTRSLAAEVRRNEERFGRELDVRLGARSRAPGADDVETLDRARDELVRAVNAAVNEQVARDERSAAAARAAAKRGQRAVVLIAILAIAAALAIALRLVRRLTASYAEAAAAVSAREQFLQVATHELAGPLHSLSSHLEPLQGAVRSGTTTELVERRLSLASEQLSRANRFVDEMLDANRMHAGRLKLAREEVDLAEIVRDVTRRFERPLAASGSALDLHVEGRVVGFWDRARVEQLVMHLVSNAIKYGEGRVIRVALEGGDPAKLVVRDHGVGIPPEHQAHIFEAYEGASWNHRHGGLGLGLYIAREIVRAHGGTIDVESVEGVGSTFTVRLPRRAQEQAAPRAPRRERAEGRPPTRH